MKRLLFLSLLIIGLGTSCQLAENNNEDVFGSWKAISWEAAGIETLGEDANVTFTFNEDDTYVASSGSSSEKGTYRLMETNLYTNAEGQVEKMVEIKLPSIDTMIMNMNRAGTEETMILVKNQ